MSIRVRPVLGLKPIFFLVLLNGPLCIGFMYAHYLVARSNSLEDIFKLSGLGFFPSNPTGENKCNSLVLQLHSYYISFITQYDFDDLLNIDNIYFNQMVDRIYPTELQINRANSSDTEAPCFDLNLCMSNGTISTKMYDKRDHLILI